MTDALLRLQTWTLNNHLQHSHIQGLRICTSGRCFQIFKREWLALSIKSASAHRTDISPALLSQIAPTVRLNKAYIAAQGLILCTPYTCHTLYTFTAPPPHCHRAEVTPVFLTHPLRTRLEHTQPG